MCCWTYSLLYVVHHHKWPQMLVTFYQVIRVVLLVHLLVSSQNLASATHSCDSVRSCDSHRAQFPVPVTHYPHSAVLQFVLSIVQSSSDSQPSWHPWCHCSQLLGLGLHISSKTTWGICSVSITTLPSYHMVQDDTFPQVSTLWLMASE